MGCRLAGQSLFRSLLEAIQEKNEEIVVWLKSLVATNPDCYEDFRQGFNQADHDDQKIFLSNVGLIRRP